MSTFNKAEKAAEKEVKKEKKYPTARLLNSKELERYQQDFARVILREPEYTISEAKAILEQSLAKVQISAAARVSRTAARKRILQSDN